MESVSTELTASPSPGLADFNSVVSFHKIFNHKED